MINPQMYTAPPATLGSSSVCFPSLLKSNISSQLLKLPASRPSFVSLVWASLSRPHQFSAYLSSTHRFPCLFIPRPHPSPAICSLHPAHLSSSSCVLLVVLRLCIALVMSWPCQNPWLFSTDHKIKSTCRNNTKRAFCIWFKLILRTLAFYYSDVFIQLHI